MTNVINSTCEEEEFTKISPLPVSLKKLNLEKPQMEYLPHVPSAL